MTRKAEQTKAEKYPEFNLRDVSHCIHRGMHALLSAVETAIREKRKVVNEVWEMIAKNYSNQIRAITLLKLHAPAFVPKPA